MKKKDETLLKTFLKEEKEVSKWFETYTQLFANWRLEPTKNKKETLARFLSQWQAPFPKK